MAVVKKGFRVQFTQVPNEVLNDNTISLKAKGLYCFILSKPDNWEFSVSGLKAQLKEGRDAIRNGLIELEDIGYLIRRQLVDDSNKFIANEYTIYDEKNPSSEKPTSENPSSEKPTQDNTILSNKELSNTLNRKEKINQKENIYVQLKSNKKLRLTKKELNDLLEIGYKKQDIDSMIEKIENYKKNRNYNSLFLTLKNWLKSNDTKKSKSAVDNLNSLLYGK